MGPSGTGLCGACTCDLADPTWTAAAHLVAGTVDGGREGFQTVRACSTRVTLLRGQSEFVIDVFRSSKARSATKRPKIRKAETAGGLVDDNEGEGEDEDEFEDDIPMDPMARFSDDWETEFVPDYKKFDAKSKTSEAHLPNVASGVAPWDQLW